MKSHILSVIAALIIICFSISYSSGELADDGGFREKKEVENGSSTAATADDVRDGEDTPETFDIIGSGSNGELYHEFTQEEIEMNRIITIDKDGNEIVSTDEEVIQTLKRARQGNLNFLRDEPHFSTEKRRRDVIGPDNRFSRTSTQFNAPYSAIGYLAPDGCTAYLVGPRHLITAAHCVHSRTNTQDIYSGSQLTFYLRRNCEDSRYGIEYEVSDVQVYSQYRCSGNSNYDIAYLLLTSTVSDWMGYAYRDPMPTVSGEICGYPEDMKDSNSIPSECFYCSKCNDVRRMRTGLFGWGRNSKRLEYTCDTEGGMSGSPVMTDDHDSSSQLYSYGVHTEGSRCRNKGVRITRNRFYDICRWKCDTGARCSALC